MNEEVVYIQVDSWLAYGEEGSRLLGMLEEDYEEPVCKLGLQYNYDIWDMAIVYFVTTTKTWLMDHGFDIEKMEDVLVKGEGDMGPEFQKYDSSIIETDKNRLYLGEEE